MEVTERMKIKSNRSGAGPGTSVPAFERVKTFYTC